MRYFQKNRTNAPAIFQEWLQENAASIEAWVKDPSKKGGDLWEQFGKTFGIDIENACIKDKETFDMLKAALEDTLLKEQNGLCCYCGDSIDIRYKSIEHFLPKGYHKTLTFDFENLMLCCKESKKLKNMKSDGCMTE